MPAEIGKIVKSITTIFIALFIFLGSNNCYAAKNQKAGTSEHNSNNKA